MTIRSNGASSEATCSINCAEALISGHDIPKFLLGKSVQVLFVPLLFRRGTRIHGMRVSSIDDGHTIEEMEIDNIPKVVGVILVSPRTNKRRRPRTYWRKFDLYTAEACTIRPLDWNDGIIVGAHADAPKIELGESVCPFRLTFCGYCGIA